MSKGTDIKCPQCNKPQLTLYENSSYALDEKDPTKIRLCLDCVRKNKETEEAKKKAEETEKDIEFILPRRDGLLLQELISKALDNDNSGNFVRSNQLSFLLGKVAKALN